MKMFNSTVFEIRPIFNVICRTSRKSRNSGCFFWRFGFNLINICRSMTDRRRSSTPNSRKTRRESNRSIQIEPRLQSLLIAENQAAQMIFAAREKRNQLMKQTHRQVQMEIDAFRNENERNYQMKLREATQIERFRVQLDFSRAKILDEMSKEFEKQRKTLVNFLVRLVVDEIRIESHPNASRFH